MTFFMESERNPILVRRIVVVGVAVVVDIADVRRVARVRGQQPPVAARAAKQHITVVIVYSYLRTSVSGSISS